MNDRHCESCRHRKTDGCSRWDCEYEPKADEEVYVLTPYGVLLSVMDDYGIDVNHITPRMAEHLFEDFMEALCKQGYVGKRGEADE